MSFYNTADQLYICVGSLFDLTLKETPGAANTLLAARLTIRLHCTAPTAQITINGRRRPVQISCGSSHLRPDLDVQLSGDTLHHILLGDLSVKKALVTGLVQVHGPVWRVSMLADFFRQAQALYPRILREQAIVRDGRYP